ncbi:MULTISPECIES: MerR family DNA-binding transcriptional regulator [Microcystis]|jgi:DNA-binding transcriptional MerR regulator|uniref:MerR family DNA-binding transcriptional regulator n=1 Tax=unclassified Microcystis TaxID=2643300 RepID=UPI000587B237|nr:MULTISPECIES: MerR family DNA-binding transcriptional regulator [Microcystis]
MSKLTRSEAAKLKGVSVSTLRRWESEGKLIPERTANGLFQSSEKVARLARRVLACSLSIP